MLTKNEVALQLRAYTPILLLTFKTHDECIWILWYKLYNNQIEPTNLRTNKIEPTILQPTKLNQ